MRRLPPLLLALLLALPGAVQAQPDRSDGGRGGERGEGPPGHQKHGDRGRGGDDRGHDDRGRGPGEGRGPPGHVRRELPPGLAKKFGRTRPERAYVAFDPRYDDRAYFLIDGRWVLQRHFDPALRREVQSYRTYEAAPPPVPLPHVGVSLNVVLF